jgi:hypothetical protein
VDRILTSGPVPTWLGCEVRCEFVLLSLVNILHGAIRKEGDQAVRQTDGKGNGDNAKGSCFINDNDQPPDQTITLTELASVMRDCSGLR